MTSRRSAPWILGAAAVAAAVSAGDAAAQKPRLASLPVASNLLPPTPPFASAGVTELEFRLPGRSVTRQRVLAVVAPDGRPWAVRAVQQIRISGLGDYVFSVPAPVVDVAAASGSESEPGLRTRQILWQGFSPGHKRIGAVATLRPVAAARLLPVRLTLDARAGDETLQRGRRASGPLRLALTIRNTTVAQATAFTADADRISAARALDELRRAQERRAATAARFVTLESDAEPKTERVVAPLQVSGTITFPTGSVTVDGAVGAQARGATARFSARLDGGEPEVRVSLRGTAVRAGPPLVRVVVRPAMTDPAARPPARTWEDAVRRNRVALSGRRLLERAISLDLAYARARQYQTFLRAPQPNTHDSTTYVFQVAGAPAGVATAARPAEDSGSGVLVAVAVVAGMMVVLGGAVVAWAHL